MDLAADEFTVSYLPGQVDTGEMLDAIAALGYRPSLARSRVEFKQETDAAGELPEMVQAALDQARSEGRDLFLEFFAEWCGACRTMDRTTFADPEVSRRLQSDFVFLKVDTDAHPDIGRQFRVLGLPTMVVLAASGDVRFRHMGPMDADVLVDVLSDLSADRMGASRER